MVIMLVKAKLQKKILVCSVRLSGYYERTCFKGIEVNLFTDTLFCLNV